MTAAPSQPTPSAPPTNLSLAGSAGSPSVAETPSSTVARSYATATKKPLTPPVATPHGKQETMSAVNGRAAAPLPMGNGADHSKKPSVTISAAGASGNLPNGGPAVTPSTGRPNIYFGAVSASGSPPVPDVARTPSQQNLSAQHTNPRVTSPATSPSPIPHPTASGGRPPSGLQPQGNGLHFGSMPGDNDQNRQMRNMPIPSGPMAQGGHQAQHLRRDSSHSAHGDMSGPPMAGSPGMINRGGYGPGGGRGRNYSNSYQQQMPYSPAQGYRNPSGQGRGGPIPPHFQNPMQQFPPSPHMASHSPAPVGSHPGTPQMAPAHMANNPQMPYQPSYGAYVNHLGAQPGQFGMQTPYDPNYYAYQMQYQMAPYMAASPNNAGLRRMSSQTHNQYSGQYNPAGQSMSRTSSQLSERPGSTVSQSHGPPPQSAPGPSHTPSQSVGGAPSSANFTIPTRAKTAIVIKNDAGEVLNFQKPSTPASAASPAPSTASVAAPPPPASPAIVSSTSTSTPPSNAPEPSQARAESKVTKTDAEKQHDFKEQVRRGLEEEKRRNEEAVAKSAKSESSTGAEPARTSALSDSTAPPTSQGAAAETSKDIPADAAQPAEDEAARRKREEDEEFERQVAEMEALEREEEEREKAYQAKKKAAAEAKATEEKEAAARAEEDMKRAEREAEAAEEAREAKRGQVEETDESRAERESLFSSLKKPGIGPGAGLESASGTATPASDDSMPPPPPQKTAAPKTKPAALKLETSKAVEPAQPTPGMQALRSARFLEIQRDAVTYPDGIQSPNPALNQSGKRNGRLYDVAFLRQFQDAFKEKPSLDWDQKLKETLGDPTDSAVPRSARTPGGMTNRQPSRGMTPQTAFPNQFGGGRTLPPGTTSHDRFGASNAALAGARPGVTPMGTFNNRGGGFPMGNPQGIGRPGSQAHSPSTKSGSHRGNKSIRGKSTRKEDEVLNRSMPLTAGTELKPLELSTSGWKPTSLTAGPAANAVGPNGHMAPDMVQRKVKAALNKMTPERFDKIADQILTIAGQSKDESDGRTLRQVIALTFEKACDEAHWASMYAKFCKRMLEEMSPEIKDEAIRDKNDKPITGGPLFRKYLLNRCQEEFERGWEVNLPDKPEGQTEEAAMLSDEYYIAAAAKRKGLGLIQFIGELYKLSMLSIRIMHECVMRLLNFTGMPDESAIESLVKLLRTVGAAMEKETQGPGLLDTYFDRIEKTMNMPGLPSRMHFMLLDTVDLRRSGWHDKNDAKGPQTIQEIREQAALAQQQADLERARQNQRGGRMPMGRGDARSFSGHPMPPPDYQKNTVGMDELRRLGAARGNSRQGSQGPASLGPTSMLGSRSGSGRASQLGPGSMLRNDSNSTNRTSTPPFQKEKKDETTVNAFSALAGLDASGEDAATPATSPSMTNATPAVAQPSDNGDKDGAAAVAEGGDGAANES